ncbi:MAG: DUF4835 family protein [Bacteroidota bacterium]
MRLLSRCGLLLVSAWMLLPQHVHAQELDCRVSVNYQQVTGTGFEFLNELGLEIQSYLNERSWTRDRYLDQERIDCTFQVFIQEAISLTNFRARLIVAARRPIYGTTQFTTVVQFSDEDWEFTYAQGTPIVFDPERYDPLASVLDFYAYILLGYDYDTFSQFGGSPHFAQARQVANLAQAQGAQGWDAIGNDQSRLKLVTQLQDPSLIALRQAYATYHLEGLDRFVSDTDAARATVLAMLQDLRELYDTVSRQYVIDLFFIAKYQELPGIFQDSDLRNEAYEILTAVDAAHLSEYNRLVE